jgi:hypothetical protein
LRYEKTFGATSQLAEASTGGQGGRKLLVGSNRTGDTDRILDGGADASELTVGEQTGDMPWRRAVDDIARGASKLSLTIRSFSSSDQRRRRPVSTTSSRSS